MDEGRRFRQKDPWKDPYRLFPSFMAALAIRYPKYRMRWDRGQEKWVVLHQLAPHYMKVVAYVEDGAGVAISPSMEWLDELTRCDVLRSFATPDAYCDWLEAEAEKAYEEGCERITESMRYAARPYFDYVCRGGPETFVIRPFSAQHRAQLEREVAMDIPGAAQPQESA